MRASLPPACKQGPLGAPDVAAAEGDKTVSRHAWRGTARNAEDTTGFGTIVLTDKLVGKQPAGAASRR